MSLRSFHRILASAAGLLPIFSAFSQPAAYRPWNRQVDHEVAFETDFVGQSDLNASGRSQGEMKTLHTSISYLHNFKPQSAWHWRAGADLDRFGFTLPTSLPLPGELTSIAAPMGLDWTPGDAWSVRLQINPGLYGDGWDYSSRDFNLPGTFGISYTPGRAVTWLVQLAIDPQRDIPVVGGLGAIWRIRDDWTLFLTLPKPRLEYRLDEARTAFIGGALQGGAFYVDNDVPRVFEGTNISGEWITYREIRVGGGLRWVFHPNLKGELETGWAIDRRFVVNDLRRQFNGDGAFYVAARLNLSF